MTIDMLALEASASHWDAASVWAAVFDFAGVGAECVTQFKAFARVALLADETRRSNVAKAGLLVLVAALTVEGRSHTPNEATLHCPELE
jgi:hypothetical protein